MAFKIVDSKALNTLSVLAGTGGLTAGGLVVITGSGTAITGVKAAAAPTAATIVGIARTTVVATAYALVDLIEDHLIEADYTGSSKTTVADTDALATFDISNETTVNLDDTTGGCFVPFGNNEYNNTQKTIRGKFTVASRFI